MKIKELIEELSKENQEDELFFVGYEGGLERIIGIRKSKVLLNSNNEDWMGSHDEFHKTKIIDEKNLIDGIIFVGEKNRKP